MPWANRVVQHIEQGRAVNAQPAAQPRQLRIGHIEHHAPAARIMSDQPVERMP
jgi:hypothetical protein